uniref:Uncharacterized protein n=1 Tax=Myotis myotis TaxID=51298 RepID=A0A7J7T677_MYOMY|nr:hypothetical protein mMyoMyo1_009252 [Myotis myotis]
MPQQELGSLKAAGTRGKPPLPVAPAGGGREERAPGWGLRDNQEIGQEVKGGMRQRGNSSFTPGPFWTVHTLLHHKMGNQESQQEGTRRGDSPRRRRVKTAPSGQTHTHPNPTSPITLLSPGWSWPLAMLAAGLCLLPHLPAPARLRPATGLILPAWLTCSMSPRLSVGWTHCVERTSMCLKFTRGPDDGLRRPLCAAQGLCRGDRHEQGGTAPSRPQMRGKHGLIHSTSSG